jgi:pimeloyl-ACP methyl ester carboxylesterase
LILRHCSAGQDGTNKGRKGDPVFDAFYTTQVETVISNEETQARNQAAGAALLDKIGPAVILTHSQSGAFGWLIADARPQLVKAIIAIEPADPPFENSINAGGKARPWGLADIAIACDPPIKQTSELAIEREAIPMALIYSLLDAKIAGTATDQFERHPVGHRGIRSVLSRHL